MNNRIESKLLEEMRNLAPDFVKYGEHILFGEVWRDPTLTPKERSLSTLSALIRSRERLAEPAHHSLRSVPPRQGTSDRSPHRESTRGVSRVRYR